MIEEEQPEGLSARKLVVETVKHNVITAYTGRDGIDLLRRFPAVDAVLVHAAQIEKRPNLLAEVKELAPHLPIILASPFAQHVAAEANYVVDSHKPQALLKVLGEDMQGEMQSL
jgi:hypothetical protein